MKNLILTFCCFIMGLAHATEFSVYEANYPNVKDYNLNIEEANLTVVPQGNFIEMNLDMTVSYDFESWFFKNYNELEFSWKFNLAEEAIMHNFWIWYGDSLLESQVLDKWTAELMFSDVSTSVRHPGLMTQSDPDRNGQVQYEIRLFPVIRNEKKHFKFQYLLPGRPSVEKLRIWLPTTQLISTKTPNLDRLNVKYKYGDTPVEPQIIGSEVLTSEDSPGDSSWNFVIPLDSDAFVEMALPSPIQSNVFFSSYEQNGEKFYHMALYPPKVNKTHKPKNLLILVDFNQFNTSGLDGDFLMSHLKETIQEALTEQDSINIMVAYDDIVTGSNTWIPCTEAKIDTLFTHVLKRSFPTYSYFQPLMIQGASYINQQKGNSDVLCITNTDEISLNESDILGFADDIIDMFKAGTKLHFIDLENKSALLYTSHYENGKRMSYYEPQLHSFYGRMTYATEGNLFYLRYHSIKNILKAFFYENVSHYETVEVQMTLQNGYSHSKHLMNLHEGYYPLDYPIMEVGKYTGELPIHLKVLGKTRKTKVVYETTITEDSVSAGSPQIATSWYGDHIHEMYRTSYDPLTVNDIIKLSIEQKIMSPYTSFLVYHPVLTGDETDDNEDDSDDNGGNSDDGQTDGVTTAVQENEIMPEKCALIQAYPNPFNARVCIALEIPEADPSITYELIIYNVLGEIIRSYCLNADRKTIEIIWDAKDDWGNSISTGIYLAVLKGPKVIKSLKLLYTQ